MHRLIRAIQTQAASSCRRLSTNSFSNGSKIPKRFTSRVAPVGAVSAFMIGGAILFQNKNDKEDNKPDKNNVYKSEQIPYARKIYPLPKIDLS